MEAQDAKTLLVTIKDFEKDGNPPKARPAAQQGWHARVFFAECDTHYFAKSACVPRALHGTAVALSLLSLLHSPKISQHACGAPWCPHLQVCQLEVQPSWDMEQFKQAVEEAAYGEHDGVRSLQPQPAGQSCSFSQLPTSPTTGSAVNSMLIT